MPRQSVGHNKPPPPSPIVGHVRERLPLETVQDEPEIPPPVLSASPSPSEVFIEEKERVKRVACRQAAYDEASCGDLAKINQAIPCDVLDFDPEKETEIVTIEKELSMKLKPHQIEGVNFMWNSCFESIERIIKHPGSGCILAHCMGLGKSLQIVTLVHTVLTNKACQVERVLIVCPVNIILNWENEFAKWLPQASSDFKIYGMASQNDKVRSSVLRSWLEGGGVLIIGYDMFRILTDERNERTREDNQLIKHSLLDPGPQLLICDEGHILKNEHTLVFKTLNQVQTRRRIVLSGTPIQNNLQEYYALVKFVKPNLLGSTTEFKDRFLDPIDKGKSADATDRAVIFMKQQSHVLHKLLGGFVQRFDVEVLSPFLPPKLEYVLSVRLSELQVQLYEHFLQYNANACPNRDSQGTRLFSHYHALAHLWTHPKALLLGDGKGKEEENLPGSSGDNGNDRSAFSAWWSPSLLEREDMTQLEHSGKLLLLFEILRQSELVGDKVLIFSQSLVSLCLIEEFLAAEDRKTRAAMTHTEESPVGLWKLDIDYFRMDGQTALEKRLSDCNRFNDPKNIRARIFLISTKAGGMGINLTAANRVIIFDASWNPSHDVQSIFRVYRLGQQKTCYIYRFLAHGTMEEKIYFRQILKQSLSCRVLDEQQIGRHFKSSDVDKLYEYESHSHVHRPTPIILKDPILAGLTIKFDKWIASYHEHGSLLKTIPEEQLSEAERTAAWSSFENDLVNG